MRRFVVATAMATILLCGTAMAGEWINGRISLLDLRSDAEEAAKIVYGNLFLGVWL